METQLKSARGRSLPRSVGRQVGVLPIEARHPVGNRIPQNTTSHLSKIVRKTPTSRAGSNTSCRSLSSRCKVRLTNDKVDILDEQETQSSASNSCKDEGNNEKVPQKFLSPKEILDLCQENDFYRVYEIDLHGMSLAEVPDLEKFRKLRVADLSGNHISRICNLEFTQDLRELKLYDNHIIKIEGLDSLKEVCSLQLQYNQIETVGKGLANLKKLQSLRLDNNRITKLEASDLLPCVQITMLDLSNNYLDCLTALTYLSNLEELYVSRNRLKKLTDLHRCKHLQELDLSRNQLTDLSGISDLVSVQILDVSENQLTTLSSLGKLKSLEELNVSGNRVSDLSGWDAAFPRLQILNLCNNRVEAWQQVCLLKGLPDLVELYLAGNPFTLEGGERPTYHVDIQTVVPSLEIIDGAHLKPMTGNAGTPLMRPMTASSMLSVRQVEAQVKAVLEEQESMERMLEKRFASLKAVFDTLPAHRPPVKSYPTPQDSSSPAPSSRCRSHARIREAQAFAQSIPDVE
ncbi:hypothetical protein C0Q70_01979 [Pomacea canaliculata]|uniref:Protein phosphatase 1 regulatory subunit 7 n=1 Tax=Pomacea canaliculata TaxID=400727 RepID=A0A2T7Q106_POMCA|nr:protein phosphatase 1 regulatory subunit 7-like [Pomacea canaliculata]PVD39349.1 hypothetical protein C0Q70_01979 [Pomacea canaliculata]